MLPPEILVVLVSAVRGAPPLPGIPFVRKPFDLDVFLATVAGALVPDG